MAIALVLAVIVAIFIVRTLRIVPQQHAWVVERLGKFDRTLTPGLNFVVPFIERVAYKHSLKEVPLDVPSQVCITKDNTQLQVDGIIYFQVTDPMRASYGSSNYVFAITQLAQTLLRSVIGKMELDKTFEERDSINASVVNALDEAAMNWGVGSTKRGCLGATIRPLSAGRKVGQGSLRSSAQRLVLRKKQSSHVTHRAFCAICVPFGGGVSANLRGEVYASRPDPSSVVYEENAVFAADRFHHFVTVPGAPGWPPAPGRNW